MINFTALKKLFNNQINMILDNEGLTLPCLFVFDRSKNTQCPNCLFDNIGRKSANRYKSGGPISFGQGQICPVCVGVGQIFNEQKETINLAVVTDYSRFLNVNQINIPSGHIQTYCSISNYVKIKTANYIIVDTNLNDELNNKFFRVADPQPIGLGTSDYLLTTWRKPANDS
jgi:hypothetical protein